MDRNLLPHVLAVGTWQSFLCVSLSNLYILLVVVRSQDDNGWDNSNTVLNSEGYNVDNAVINLSDGIDEQNTALVDSYCSLGVEAAWLSKNR